jgi:cell division protein FtsL
MAKQTTTFGLSTKRLKIEKSNTKVLIAVCVAVVVVVFSIIAGRALYKQYQYQAHVLSLRNKASRQLQTNIAQSQALAASYTAFNTAPESIMGNNENNSKIVLNALPSKYDFPALATSLEGLMSASKVAIGSISGTDEQATAEQSAIDPQPKEVGFAIGGKGSYAAVQTLVINMERSTRPMVVSDISFKGSDSDMTFSIKGVTYYQPLKQLDLQKKVVPGPTKAKNATKDVSKSTSSGGTAQ